MTEAAPTSLWLARSRHPERVDVAVIGGGVVGLSAAYWLSQAGVRPVLLESADLARGATGRSAGFLLTGAAEPYRRLAGRVGARAARRFWELSRENRELLRGELLDPGKIDCEFQAEGSWIAALDQPEKVAELEVGAGELAALGIEVEWRGRDEVQAASGSPLLGGAIFQPRDGGLDPVLLCRGIAALCELPVRSGFPVRALEPLKEGILILGEHGRLLARKVVVALNAYAPALLPHLTSQVHPVRGQMLATAPGKRFLSGVWYLDGGFEYARQLADGTLLLGGRRREAIEEEIGYLASPTARVQGALDRFLREAFPRAGEWEVRHRWAGIMGFTSEGLPAVGEVPGVPGACYAAGFTGHGLSLGFVVGRYLARRCLEEEVEPLFPGVAG